MGEYRIKKYTTPIVVFLITLTLTSCTKQVDKEKSVESPAHDNETRVDSGMEENNLDSDTDEKQSEIIGDYQYPDNPAEQLRSALEKDANERGLPMEIGNVEKIEIDNKEYSQILIYFNDSNENVCIISFFNKHLEYGYEQSLDGRDNPSFTMAFKDPDNSRDMITVLTSVILYISPDLNPEEAERLAINQDKTISTDGYAQPLDIGGYQIQAQYTNPHVFVSTPDFEARLGVRVRALKQIWRGAIDIGRCQELITPEDYTLLTTRYNHWDEGNRPAMVYADFIVENTWRNQSYIHGETWMVVDVESMTGQQYSIILDTWAFPNTYEFGAGQQYTLFIGLDYSTGARGGIMYAIQQSESEEFNSRGEQHPLDYPTEAWYDHLWRVEPESKGTIYNVYFVLKSQTWGEALAALEGHGVGDAQWPGSPPAWEGYTFVGWYDKNGSPCTKDTPIYQNTYLFARWKYSGSGGIWPRAHHGDIQGIAEGGSLSAGEETTITVSGYNMNLKSPKEQRFRWIPRRWTVTDSINGDFLADAPYSAEFSVGEEGAYTLYITYLEEIFDGITWQETGQIRDVEEIIFQVIS